MRCSGLLKCPSLLFNLLLSTLNVVLPKISNLNLSIMNVNSCSQHNAIITEFVTILTQRVPLVEQELVSLPEHLSSPPVFSGVRITRSLVLCVWFFLDRCLFFCTFSVGHCVCSSIYGF